MNKEILLSELHYKAVRSSGSGGQNVNKVSSKVVLSFNLETSQAFEEKEKEIITNKLKTKITQENLLILNCDEDRSQLKNKKLVTQRFLDIIENALVIPKKRKKTSIPKAINEKRIQEKKINAEIKSNRKKPNL
jgi:ribosome-associated protein